MIGYMTWRMLIDFLKPGIAVAGLTVIQWAAVAVLIYYLRDIARFVGFNVIQPDPGRRRAGRRSAGCPSTGCPSAGPD